MDKPGLLYSVINKKILAKVLEKDKINLFFKRRNNKSQYRGKLNLIGRLQLSTEKNREEENQEIIFLRAERTKVIGKQRIKEILKIKLFFCLRKL